MDNIINLIYSNLFDIQLHNSFNFTILLAWQRGIEDHTPHGERINYPVAFRKWPHPSALLTNHVPRSSEVTANRLLTHHVTFSRVTANAWCRKTAGKAGSTSFHFSGNPGPTLTPTVPPLQKVAAAAPLLLLCVEVENTHCFIRKCSFAKLFSQVIYALNVSICSNLLACSPLLNNNASFQRDTRGRNQTRWAVSSATVSLPSPSPATMNVQVGSWILTFISGSE